MGYCRKERKASHLRPLREHGAGPVDDLSKHWTLRRDHTARPRRPGAAGGLDPASGGALARREDDDLPIVIKQPLHHSEKSIAKAAAALINDGQTSYRLGHDELPRSPGRFRTLELKSINVITTR